MGQLTLPENALIAPTAKANMEEATTANLAECQSPFARWLEQPVYAQAPVDMCGLHQAPPVAEATAERQEAQKAASLAVVQPAPWIMMVPVVMEPQQLSGLSGNGMEPNAWNPASASGQSNLYQSNTGSAYGITGCPEPQQFSSSSMKSVAWNYESEFPCGQSDWPQSSSGSAHGSTESDSGYADLSMVTHGGPRLSASAARRRRRQRAAERWTHDESAKTSVSNTEVAFGEGRGSQARSNGVLLARLDAGGEELSSAIAEIRGAVRRLTFDAAGCRIVQRALEVADPQDAVDFTKALHGCVRNAIGSPHGNYVIQKVIEVLPVSQSSFVAAELRGAGAEVSRHRFGCRIICRLLEHSGSDPLTINLVDEILQHAGELCRDTFGHHVIESILEHCPMEQRHQVAAALHTELLHNATDRHATYVIESALRHCSHADQVAIVSAFLSNQEALLWLAEHQSGFHVVKALLKHSEQSDRISDLLKQASDRLEANIYGRRVLEILRSRAVKH